MSDASATRCWACAAPVDATTDSDGYVRCAACALRFYPSGEAPRAHYDDNYFADYAGGDYFATEALRRHEARVRLRLVRQATGPAATQLLEVGSAAGFFMDEARKSRWSVRGIEPAEGPATYARTKLGLDVVSTFAEDAELPASSVDAVCLWHTLEHIPDPADLLRNLLAALRPGGVLVIEIPNGASLLAKRSGSDWFALEPEVHVAQWTPTALGAVLASCGYAVDRVYTVPFLTYVAGWRRRLPRRAWLAIRQRAWLRDPHPAGHELLRAVARRPHG